MSLPEVRGLLEAAYGSAPAESELEWWFRGPAGSQILVENGQGADGMSLARVAVEGVPYRGSLRVLVNPRGTLNVVSRVDLEEVVQRAVIGISRGATGYGRVGFDHSMSWTPSSATCSSRLGGTDAPAVPLTRQSRERR